VPQRTASWQLQEGIRRISDFEWGSGYHKDWKTVPPSTDVEFLRAITLAKYRYTSTNIQYAACLKKTTRNVRTHDEPTELRTSKLRTQASTLPPNQTPFAVTAWMTMASTLVWHVTPCSLAKGANCRHLEDLGYNSLYLEDAGSTLLRHSVSAYHISSESYAAQWLLYVPPVLTFRNFTFCPVYWRVLCGSENKRRLFPYTTLTDWFL